MNYARRNDAVRCSNAHIHLLVPHSLHSGLWVDLGKAATRVNRASFSKVFGSIRNT